jgi:hypothetical protein
VEIIGYGIVVAVVLLVIFGAANQARDEMQRTDDIRAIRRKLETE